MRLQTELDPPSFDHQDHTKAMFGRKERIMEEKKNLKRKKIKVIEKKMIFLYIVWYVGRKRKLRKSKIII